MTCPTTAKPAVTNRIPLCRVSVAFCVRIAAMAGHRRMPTSIFGKNVAYAKHENIPDLWSVSPYK